MTEFEVESDVKRMVSKTKGLVVCSFPTRDLDRMLSFYNAAKEAERELVIDLKQAFLLKLFQASEQWKNVFPRPDDKHIRVYIPRKNWGILGKDPEVWTEKLLFEDYKEWEREFLDYGNRADYRDVSAYQKEMIFCCNDFQLKELTDVRPEEGSQYVRSTTEPFDDEMELSEGRVLNWLVHFRLVTRKDQLARSHVSGHGDGTQIKHVIDGTDATQLIPIHTENEGYHKKWHSNVREVRIGHTLRILAYIN
jgi:ribonuclease J